MRCNFILMTFMAMCTSTAHSAVQTPAAAVAKTVITSSAPTQPAAATEATIATLADVARAKAAAAASGQLAAVGQPNSSDLAPRAGPIQSEKPLAIVDGAGRVLDDAAVRLSAAATVKPKRRVQKDLELQRISSSGSARRALISVNGVGRFVDVGSQVLKKTVGEIRNDGVCLYAPPSKDKCGQFLTFVLPNNE